MGPQIDRHRKQYPVSRTDNKSDDEADCKQHSVRPDKPRNIVNSQLKTDAGGTAMIVDMIESLTSAPLHVTEKVVQRTSHEREDTNPERHQTIER